jgi:hypothetical protein
LALPLVTDEAGFDIAGRVSLALRSLPDRDVARLTAALDPYGAGPVPAEPDVIVERLAPPLKPLVDVQRDAGDSRVTGTDGERFYLLARGRRCALPPLGAPPPARIALQAGFAAGRPVARILRYQMQLALHRRGAVAVHGAAVELAGRGLVVAGWSESGKTETALALAEAGATFLSDKWTVVAEDLTAAAFPIGVGVRGWTLAHLPRLRATLAGGERARLMAAAAGRAALRPLRGHDTVDRLLGLADRVSLPPTALRRAYGTPPDRRWETQLEALALLTTVPQGTPVGVAPADAAWAAARLANTAAFERRGFFELHDRATWAFDDRAPAARDRIREHERALLERALARIRVIEVRAPFPTDPRPVADAIRRHL